MHRTVPLARTLIGLMLGCLCIVVPIVAGAAERKPNIIVIVADDLGYADLGFQGGRDIPTPNLDQLAARGMRLSNGYVSGAWCTPTRAGLLTGRYQQRFGEHGHENEPDTALDLAETTLAERLRAAGYATGLVGKWHLGTSDEHHPQRRGFDEFFGFLRGAHNFLPDVPFILFPDHNGDGEDLVAIGEGRAGVNRAIMRGTELVHEPGYLTEAFGREGVSFVRRHADQPFFLYLSFNAVHTPMQATDPLLAMFASVQHPVRRIYNAMTYSMDDAIGAVLDQLRASGIEEDTLVFFISDNGGPTIHRYAYNASDNSPLRGSKGTTLEGGIRIPFVVSWPGTLEGGSVFDAPAITLDIAPTALAAAGISVQPDMALDGVDLLPHLQGEVNSSPHEQLFWRGWGQMAVRQGDWKLVSYVAKMDEGELKRGEARNVMTPHRLYNLRRDIGESQDLADAEPERVADLLEVWRAWNAQMKAPPQLQ
jgi:arylsulfatase A-like enzyme